MRILHVVTLLGPDGAYGGPARVALNQSAALIDRGHEVTVAAGTRGFRVTPNRVDGVPVQLFPPARTSFREQGSQVSARPACNGGSTGIGPGSTSSTSISAATSWFFPSRCARGVTKSPLRCRPTA